MAAEPPKVRRPLLAYNTVVALVSVVANDEDVRTCSGLGRSTQARCSRRTGSQRLKSGQSADVSPVSSLVDEGTVLMLGTGLAVAASEAAFDALSGGLEPASVADVHSRASATGDVGGNDALSRLQPDPSDAAIVRRDALYASRYNAISVASSAAVLRGRVSREAPVERLAMQGPRAGRTRSDLTASLAKVGSPVTSNSTPLGQAAYHVHSRGSIERTHQTRDQCGALGDALRGSDRSARRGQGQPTRGEVAPASRSHRGHRNDRRTPERNHGSRMMH